MPKLAAKNALTVAQQAEQSDDWRTGLPLREQGFICEYLVDFNATAAAIRCGYKKETATETSARLMRSPRVKAGIERLFASKGVTAQRIVEEIAAIAFSNATDYVEIKGGRVVVKDTDELTDLQKKAVAGISETITKYGTATNVKLADKLGALNSLARAAGLHKEHVQVSGEVNHNHKVSREQTKEIIDGLFDRLASRQQMKVIEHEPTPPVPALPPPSA